MPEQRSRKNDVGNANPDRVERFVSNYPYRESADNIQREHKNAKREERKQESHKQTNLDNIKTPDYRPTRVTEPPALPTFSLLEEFKENKGSIMDDLEDLDADIKK